MEPTNIQETAEKLLKSFLRYEELRAKGRTDMDNIRNYHLLWQIELLKSGYALYLLSSEDRKAVAKALHASLVALDQAPTTESSSGEKGDDAISKAEDFSCFLALAKLKHANSLTKVF